MGVQVHPGENEAAVFVVFLVGFSNLLVLGIQSAAVHFDYD